MAKIMSIRSIEPDNADEWGLKAAGLGRLAREFRVPHGFVIGSSVFEELVREKGIRARVLEILQNLSAEDDEMLQDNANEIQKLVLAMNVPGSLAEEIKENYDSLGIDRNEPIEKLVSEAKKPVVVVRASPDTLGLETLSLLYVQGHEKLLRAVLAVYASLYTRGSLKASVGKRPKMAVVVQEFVYPHVSGSIMPAPEGYLVSACWGLLDKNTACDRYVVSSDMGITTIETQKQSVAYMKDPLADKISRIELTPAKSMAQKLAEKQALALVRLYRRAGQKDAAIDYIIDRENYYFIQSRATRNTAIPAAENGQTREEQFASLSGRAGADKPQVEKRSDSMADKPNTIFSVFNANRGSEPVKVNTEPKKEEPEKSDEFLSELADDKPTVVDEDAEQPDTELDSTAPLEETAQYESDVFSENGAVGASRPKNDEIESIEPDLDDENVPAKDPVNSPKREIPEKKLHEVHPLKREEWVETLRLEHTKLFINYDLIISGMLRERYNKLFNSKPPGFLEMIDDLKTKMPVPCEEEIKRIRQLRSEFDKTHRTVSMDAVRDAYLAAEKFIREF